ncbi:3-hydroxyisobutyryl-CoA hydrolase [Gonioctena quinquepunctata]|nr:3-hydroxyisobutyryl-CoA hydrolase [Gonioctena quinquepunctata]
MISSRMSMGKLKSFAPTYTKYFSIRRKEDDKLIVDNFEDKGVITLNRPKHLNAVDFEMILDIFSSLKEWQETKNLVMIKGAGEKAFCAGGDLKLNIQANEIHDYFHTYHKTILLTHVYKVPLVAVMDGIVMGGGAGLSVFTMYRVATERTVFAMPETKIGLFPNVGASYFLSRLSGKLGWYLGLTGTSLRGSDVVRAGVATHYCRSSNIPLLEEELLQSNNTKEIEMILDRFSEQDLPELTYNSVKDEMDHCFHPSTMEEIISRLENNSSDWAKETLSILNKASPTSLKVTMKEFDLGKDMDLKECLNMEYRLNLNFLFSNKDIHKGIV